MKSYEHRQFGWFPIAICGAIAIIAVGMGTLVATPVPVVMGAVLCAVAAAFSSMVIRVDDAGISWAYTFGIPGGMLAFADIERIERVKTNVIEGWGIHWSWWHGWLWNVSGFDAVEIFRTARGPITLGTDDIENLYDAIERHRRSPQA